MKAPGFWHMAFASLVSAYSWTPLGRGSSKDYLDTQRDLVLNSEAMRGALLDAQTGTPDEGKTSKRYYHNWKDMWPTFWETATAEEMPSKYHSFCGVVAGMILATVLFVILKAILEIAT